MPPLLNRFYPDPPTGQGRSPLIRADRIAGLNAFTLIELLVVISIIALLIGILLPSLAQAREAARAISCASQLRQFGMAAEIYANDYDEFFPPRSMQADAGNPGAGRIHWPSQYGATMATPEMLLCPSDDPEQGTQTDLADAQWDNAPRSYIFNGWNDVYTVEELGRDVVANPAVTGSGWAMKRVLLNNPSDTIIFGEQSDERSDHYYMDMFEGGSGNDFEILEYSMHGLTQGNRTGTGYSNYTFADASVRGMKFPEWGRPENRWASVTEARTNYAF